MRKRWVMVVVVVGFEWNDRGRGMDKGMSRGFKGGIGGKRGSRVSEEQEQQEQEQGERSWDIDYEMGDIL
ncbi:hypothetical protein M0802_016310 [Mischocyttarus mexicanus]|nr:hypothetical protein M0802_016310 [Mischocyttarus mexicanus]